MSDIKINGNKYDLLYNGAAMFNIRELCGEITMTEAMKGDDAEAFERLCCIAAELAKQGELLRRFMGEDALPILTADEIKATLSPLGAVRLRTAVINAVIEGYKRSTAKENEEIDLGLAELNQKKRPSWG